MSNLYSNLVNKYPVQKTLRFELKPVGKTLENIEKKGYIAEGEKRAKDYKIVKKAIDRYHKKFIEDTLRNVKLEGLDGYMELYCKRNRTDKENQEFRGYQESLRSQIVDFLKSDERFNDLFKEKLIKNRLENELELSDEETEAINNFKGFTTFFKGLHENRKNMYDKEEKSTAISFRLINQNLPRFVDNIIQFRMITDIDNENIMEAVAKNCKEYTGPVDIYDYFNLDYFNFVLNQAGIDNYNRIVGELNRYINEYNQKLDKDQRNQRIGKLKILYKQVLSDRSESPFSIEAYDNDKALISDILLLEEQSEPALITVKALFENIETFDTEGIYIGEKNISYVSQKAYAGYDYIERYVSIRKGQYYSIREIESAVPEDSKGKLTEWIKQLANYVYICLNAKEQMDAIGLADYPESKDLSNDKCVVAYIKTYIDSLMDVLHAMKVFMGYEGIKDEVFYGDFSAAYMNLECAVSIYNMTRNYVTKKPYSTEKVKLNFSKGTFLDGWDLNKESDNLGTILMRDNKYYLAIIDKKNSKILESVKESQEGDVYHKMEYKLLPGPNKMLPKVFFAKSNIEYFNPSEEILRIRKEESFKKGAKFNKNDCHKFIDFYKESIEKHPDWSQFNFKFSDTSSYEDISAFYREISEQGYKISFKRIDAAIIDSLVEEGAIHLFQIYNKDFSPYSKGTPNLHTLYWKMLFDSENLNDVVYKLNGEAEVFYRRASIKSDNRIIHPANETIENKNPENQKKESTFEYDIIKDRRFTVDKLQFHVPITMNYKASGKNNINEDVNRAIKYGETPYVIGIDRGERHLLYVTVVNPSGRIVEQYSLNEIISNGYKVNYHNLLETKEKERASARKDWNTIGTIKELKEGYLSQVVHVITELMKKYNAIVVLEDLNSGFKRGRQKVEKQVYQKFEKNLIEKLNYYVDKSETDINACSGLLKANQLTNKFESFAKLGKQSGVLFYVSAWNTSKIDPTTGFVNLFYTKYESVPKSRQFWSLFSSIKYNGEYFEFEVDDYSKFTNKATGSRKNWTICSYGERISTFRNKDKNGNWDNEVVQPTQMLIKLFVKNNIDYSSDNLVDTISSFEEKDFFVELYYIFKLIVQMRNSITGSDIDYMISPVKNKNGEFYDSRTAERILPINADANGAYNIARKGLWVIEQIKQTDDSKLGRPNLKMDNETWLKYAQENC